MFMLLTLAIPALLLGLASSDDDGGDENETLRGDMADDTIDGAEGNDFIVGNEGDDVLLGGAGNDVLFGNEGEDVLRGGDDRDMLCSGDDNDIVSGNRGQDTIEGQGGDDWVNGDYSSDTVTGGEGNDTVIGGRGEDVLAGQQGNDIVFSGILDGSPVDTDSLVELRDGAALNDVLENGSSEAQIRDDSHADSLYGGDGQDTLLFGGEDVAVGGAGADLFGVFATQGLDGPATISDMTAEDSLAVIVQTNAQLDLTMADEGDNAVLRLNGEVLAVVSGGAGTVTIDDVSLIRDDVFAAQLDPNA